PAQRPYRPGPLRHFRAREGLFEIRRTVPRCGTDRHCRRKPDPRLRACCRHGRQKREIGLTLRVTSMPEAYPFGVTKFTHENASPEKNRKTLLFFSHIKQ